MAYKHKYISRILDNLILDNLSLNLRGLIVQMFRHNKFGLDFALHS